MHYWQQLRVVRGFMENECDTTGDHSSELDTDGEVDNAPNYIEHLSLVYEEASVECLPFKRYIFMDRSTWKSDESCILF